MRKIFQLALLLLAMCGSALAQYTTHSFTIPASHPRLWWNSTRLSAAQTWLTANPNPATWTCAATPSGSGDYICMAFKHAVRGDDCSAAVTWAANVNQSSPVNGWPPSAAQTTTAAIGSDTMRTTAEAAYLVYDWCYDQWSSGQKSAFVASNLTWTQNVDQQSWGGPTMTMSNYFLGDLKNDLEFGIIAYGETGCGSGPGSACDNLIDSALNTRYANFKTDSTAHYLGGVPEEGTEYGTSFEYLLIPFETVKLGGRDLYAEAGFNKQLLYWNIYNTTPAPTYNIGSGTSPYGVFTFSDDEITSSGGIYQMRSYWQDYLSRQSNYWTGSLSQYSRLLYNNIVGNGNTKGLDPWFQSVDATPSAATNFSALPLDLYGSGNLQNAYVRSAWDTTSTATMLQLGKSYSTGHFHSDLGNLSIWRGGRWVMRESTGYGESIAGTPGIASNASQAVSSQFGHNGLSFTNVALGQDSSALYTLPTVQYGVPTVNRLESQSGYFYANADFTPIYLWDSGHASFNTGVVGHVEAEFIYVRSLETWVRLYRVLTQAQTHGGSQTAAGTVTSLFSHYETNPTIEDANHYTATNGTQVARQTVLIPSSATYRVVTEGGGVGQYRVEVDNSGAAQRYHLDVIQARSTSGSNLTASVVDSNSGSTTLGTFTVTLHPATGSDTTIVFNKGQTSSGGTINVAASGVTSLISSVMPIAYTDDGPQWDVVISPTLSSITVSPSSASIVAGSTQQFTAACSWSDSTTTCPTLTWASSATSKATVDSSGLATGVAVGSSNITAAASGVTSNNGALTVTAAPVTVQTGIWGSFGNVVPLQ